MEQTRQINEFPFYDFYAEILNGLTDKETGRMAKKRHKQIAKKRLNLQAGKEKSQNPVDFAFLRDFRLRVKSGQAGNPLSVSYYFIPQKQAN